MSELDPGRGPAAASRMLDAWAICLSGLCLIHCLALPVAAALLPIFGSWAKAEWVHVLFVVIATPLSALALLRRTKIHGSGGVILGLAAIGVGLLALGALVARPELETPVTVAGSLCLAGAHVWNWRRRSTYQGQAC